MRLSVDKIQKVETSTLENEKTVYKATLLADHKKVILTQEEEFGFGAGDTLELTVSESQTKLEEP